MSGYPYSQRAVQKPLTQSLEIEVLLTFTEYVVCSIHICVSHPSIGELVQATVDTLPTERASIRLFRIIDRNIVPIQATCLRSVRFFLFDISHTVTLAKSFQCFTQITKTDLRKLLVGYPTQVDTTFKVTVITTNDGSDTVFNTVVDDIAGSLAKVVLCTIVKFFICYTFYL